MRTIAIAIRIAIRENYHESPQRQTSAKAVEKDFPHIVDMVVPLGGLGNRLDAMYDFHTRHGIKPQRGHGRHDANGAVIRWCFADPAVALEFANQFDGVMQLPPSIL